MAIDAKGALKRFSGAIIRPVLFLAVSGVLLAVSVLLRLNGMPQPLVDFGTIVYTCMSSGVVGNLNLLFCIGVACALANKKKGDAAVVAAATLLVYLYANNTWLKLTDGLIKADSLYGTGQGMVLGVQVVDMGVFIGIILGCLVGWLHNKYCDTKFPEVVSCYGGTKFVFLITIFVAIFLGIVNCYIWPVVNSWINALQGFMYAAGYAGTFVYAFLNKLLIPTGMHHLLWMPFMYSSVGGTAVIAGQEYAGSYNIFMGELGNAATITSMDPSIRFSMLGFGKWFGTIGAILAFISVAPKERRGEVRAMLVPVALVAILAGVTEPFDFLYLWTSPILYVVNSALDGIFQCILYACGWRALLTGLIETIPGLIALPASLSHWYVVIPVGAVAVLVWFVVFRFLILKLNLVTPGREDESVLEGSDQISVIASGDGKSSGNVISVEAVENIIEGLGGPDNIKKVFCCFTRLRCDLNDMSLLDEEKVNKVKNSGIIKADNNVQIVIGMSVQDVCEAVNTKLGREIE